MAGSLLGDVSQHAMFAGTGTPMVSSAAINGMTPHEQNGERLPNNAANSIIIDIRPLKARAISASASDALAKAAILMARIK
jgi:hypothetical protein